MQLKAIVAPKRTYRQKLFITYIMCTQMQRLKLNMNAVNQVKHSNCYLKSKSLHAVLNAINTITSVNDVYYVTSRCPYKLCSRVFQSRVFNRPLLIGTVTTDAWAYARRSLYIGHDATQPLWSCPDYKSLIARFDMHHLFWNQFPDLFCHPYFD